MAALNNRLISSTKPADHDQWLWDEEVPGFGVRITPRRPGPSPTGGVKTYVFQYKVRGVGKAKRMTLGRVGVLMLEDARARARRHRVEVHEGGDPVEALRAAARARDAARTAPTVADLCERFLNEHVSEHRKRSTEAGYRSLINRHIIPALGRLKVAEVTREHVSDLHRELGQRAKIQANRALACLSKMFSLAEVWGLRPDGSNPCRHVPRYRETARERYLSSDELVRLGEVLAAAERTGTEPSSAVACIRLLLFTGARRGEIERLRWEHVDLERRILLLPDSKTGKKTIQLNAPAIEALSKVPRDDSGWVIPGAQHGKPIGGLTRMWFRIRKRAGLDGVRLHDLRHTTAATLAGAGTSLRVIGALLGHRVAQTTQRYAHIADNPLREASERAGARIDAMMRRGPGADVVHLAKRDRA